jgi:glutathione S-transferase
MIVLYGFGNIFPAGRGETKDLRAQWALEETGLPYRVHALDHGGGELDGEAYSRISPFHQVPVIDDDGFVVAESAAVVLYLAEKAGRRLSPPSTWSRPDGTFPEGQGLLRAVPRAPGLAAHPRALRRATGRERRRHPLMEM